MSRVEKTVFVSYRRTNSFHALAVFQDLTRNGYDVFMDYRGIDSGSFERVILENIASRAHFVVILTPSALERCDEPGDWLRREIEYALDSKRNIVPLMFDDFSFSTPSIARYLTGKLEILKGYNAQRVPADFFDEAMERVRTRFLNVAVDAVLHPRSSQAEAAAGQEQRAAGAQPAVAAQSLSAEAWFERGLKATTPEDKIHAYTQALGVKPDYALAYNNRGAAYNHLHRYDDALRDNSEAIRLKPDFVFAYFGRGLAYYDLKRYDDALREYSEAIRLKPDYVDAYYNRGVAYHNLKRHDDAVRDYSEAIRLKPDHINAHYNRANIHKDAGRNRDAIADYQRYLDLGGGQRDGDQAVVEGWIRELKAKL